MRWNLQPYSLECSCISCPEAYQTLNLWQEGGGNRGAGAELDVE